MSEWVIAIAQLLGAFVLSFNCWQTWNNGRHGRKLSDAVAEVKENISIVEKATNSMKDALVEATAKASLAEGTAAGLEQGRKEARDNGVT
jgi:hypothetical protein